MWNQLESWGVTAKGFQAGWENNYGRVAKYGTTKEKTMYTPKEWYKETDKDTGLAKFTAGYLIYGEVSKGVNFVPCLVLRCINCNACWNGRFEQ